MASEKRYVSLIFFLFIIPQRSYSYEKTLRKIVRNQSKMVQQPFSATNDEPQSLKLTNSSSGYEIFFPPGYSQVKTFMHNNQRPKMSTILSSIDTGRSKSTYSRIKIGNTDNSNPLELRLSRNTFKNLTIALQGSTEVNYLFYPPNSTENSIPSEYVHSNHYQIPTSVNFFPSVDPKELQNVEKMSSNREHTIIIPIVPETEKDNDRLVLKGIFIAEPDNKPKSGENIVKNTPNLEVESDDKPDFIIEEVTADLNSEYTYNISINPFICSPLQRIQADIDVQAKFLSFDIEPIWVSKKHYWDNIFDSRYESLMRSSSWPPLQAILMPSSHVDSIWKKTFEHNHNNTVSKILSNIVKKLQFYSNFTFTWNEVSHLSVWWRRTSQKSRSAFRKLLKSGRLEITTGWWVETEEAPSDLFGLVHQLIEGHQWLKSHLNYIPSVAWSTNSVTHSPTLAYLLSAAGINKYVITNLHYAWEKYFAEFQYSDFVWLQDWDSNIETPTNLNNDLERIGNNRYAKHSVFTHFLQFNSDSLQGCGPNKQLCAENFDFTNAGKNIDIHTYNVKQKSEILLEQYSKTGTITPHNVLIAPLGGRYKYESQTEFDYQYNNYQRLSDFINTNSHIYKANLEFGTPKDYFNTIFNKHKTYPTLKGDFLNFADISTRTPAYWTGFFTSRPLLKILLRRIHSTLRKTEILLSFAVNFNVLPQNNTSHLFQLIVKARETVARLQDRHVVGGTVSTTILQYIYKNILSTVKDCWYIQEIAASLLTAKSGTTTPFLKKFVYREGEFISTFKTINPGDQLYFFNSLSQERTEIVELITKQPNIRIIDYNKKELTVQINPMWTYNSDNIIKISRKYFKIYFVIVIPPMTLELYKIKDTFDATSNAATVYCVNCMIEDIEDHTSIYPFSIQPLQPGDVQLENYKYRIIIDEFTGFLKSVLEKETYTEKSVVLDYGMFKSSDINSGMFLFNTNVTNPLYDILSDYRLGIKDKIAIIIAGSVTTEMTSIYGRLLQHTIKLFNLLSSPLANAIYVESKVDYEVSPKNRELELFLSIKTDINNGNNPEIVIDNNGFQYTSHILNISRRIESNMFPITSMVYIQDHRSRFTLITDHAQGVTALQEGHLAVMLDRRILFNDGCGTNEGLADSSATHHRYFLLIENFITSPTQHKTYQSKAELKLPSLSAIYLSNSVDKVLDVFIIDKKIRNISCYAFLPLIKTSLPCDMSIVNFRVVAGKAALQMFVPSTVLLVLHRQVATCRIDSSLVFCNGDTNFVVERVFHNVKAIFHTNLVATNEGIPISIVNENNFSPMELMTLKLYF